MHSHRLRHFCFVLSAVVIGEAVASTPATPDLLVNGDAEAQRCTVDWRDAGAAERRLGRRGAVHRARY